MISTILDQPMEVIWDINYLCHNKAQIWNSLFTWRFTENNRYILFDGEEGGIISENGEKKKAAYIL